MRRLENWLTLALTLMAAFLWYTMPPRTTADVIFVGITLFCLVASWTAVLKLR